MDTNEKNNNKIILIGVALIAMVFVFTVFRSGFGDKKDSASETTKKILDYPKITSEDLKNKLKNNEDLKIIDIRSSDDFAMEHLINSINISNDGDINLIPKEKIIIIIGYSSKEDEYTKIIDLLREKKYEKFFILTGGLDAWKQSGGNIISIGNPILFTDTAKVTFISPEELKTMVENKNYPKYIIDVRSKQLFDEEHIFGAENIFLDELEKSKDKIPFGKEIFIYGESDLPGFQGGVRLYDLGFMTAKVLKGGIYAWKEKGFEVTK